MERHAFLIPALYSDHGKMSSHLRGRGCTKMFVFSLLLYFPLVMVNLPTALAPGEGYHLVVTTNINL